MLYIYRCVCVCVYGCPVLYYCIHFVDINAIVRLARRVGEIYDQLLYILLFIVCLTITETVWNTRKDTIGNTIALKAIIYIYRLFIIGRYIVMSE